MAVQPATASGVFRFGDDFELDLPAYEVRSAGIPLKLKPIPMELLMFLVEHRGDLVTRGQIVERIWGKGVFLDTDNSINGAISRIRQVLRDDAAQPRFVQTVTGRGYRFIATVTELLPPPPPMVDAPRPPVEGLIGKKVTHYRILELLGGGGMGVVYKAEDLKLGRRVAIKFLPSELASDPKALTRLEGEARAASALDHRNICSIYELDEHDGQPFIVMQLLEGQSLQEQMEAVADHGAIMPLAKVLTIAAQMAGGLEAAHVKGFIHRDIKPANIFITRSNEAKILDFGLAQSLEEGEGSHEESVRSDTTSIPHSPASAHPLRLTMTGARMGTAFYMSPEQVRGEKLDARTDIFSFGLVLYQMLSGQRAFPGNTTQLVHDGILNHTPVPLREINPTLPAKLVAIVDKCLEKERERRYQSAVEIRADLEQLQRESQTRTPKLGVPGRWISFAAAALLVALLVGVGLYWRSHYMVKLTASDTIVLGDFSNNTADPVLGDALNVALDTEFSQTPSLTVLSVPKRREALRGMGLDPLGPLNGELAQDVCRRTNSKVLVEPSVSDHGDRYQIILKTVNCQNGNILATVRVEAERRSDLVKMTGVAGYQVRQKLGEPEASLNAFNEPLEMAQSGSPEAIQAVSQATAIAQAKGDREALPYAKRAVELDPSYVYAYRMLSSFYSNLGEDTLSRQAAAKAYELRNRLGINNRYRNSLENYYCVTVIGDLEKAVQFNQWMIQQYPNSAREYANLGYLNVLLGQFEKAIPQLEEANRLYPDGIYPYWNLMNAYLAVNQLDDAKSVFDRAMVRKLDADELRDARYRLAFLQGNQTAMQEQVTWASGKPNARNMLLRERAQTEAYQGHLARARALTQQGMSSVASGMGPDDNIALGKALQAWSEAEVGSPTLARETAAEALKLKLPQVARALVALVFARIGEVARASKMAGELNREFPLDTFVQNYWLPSIRAAIALERNNPQDAIRDLSPAVNYELGLYPAPTMQPPYLRGLAYLKAGQAQEASVEFKKILNHPGVVVNYATGALARLQLARAQAMMGDTEAARDSYANFLAIWKDADPDIPIYRQAKAEYAKLL